MTDSTCRERSSPSNTLSRSCAHHRPAPDRATIRVGRREIGAGCPAFIAAEVGINHNGDLDLAHALIDAAAEAGADAVKFQNYRTEDFVADRALTHGYVSQGRQVVEPQAELFKRCELNPEALLGLREHCDRRGVVFFSTPTGEPGLADLVRVGTPLLKNGSDYLGHLPLVRSMAKTGVPTVISAGMATLAEIDDAVRAFREAGGTDLILLHCTSQYPTPPEDVHLRKIPALAAAFGCPVGLSDHSVGIAAAIGAVALGACFIEKHFTLDRALPGPDHRFSCDPAELRALVNSVRTVERSLGRSVIGPTEAEVVERRGGRLSCVAARDLRADETILESDLAFRRPGTGLPPGAVSWLAGRRLRREMRAGALIQLSDIV